MAEYYNNNTKATVALLVVKEDEEIIKACSGIDIMIDSLRDWPYLTLHFKFFGIPKLRYSKHSQRALPLLPVTPLILPVTAAAINVGVDICMARRGLQTKS